MFWWCTYLNISLFFSWIKFNFSSQKQLMIFFSNLGHFNSLLKPNYWSQWPQWKVKILACNASFHMKYSLFQGDCNCEKRLTVQQCRLVNEKCKSPSVFYHQSSLIYKRNFHGDQFLYFNVPNNVHARLFPAKFVP